MKVQVYQIQSEYKINKYPNTVTSKERKYILKNYYLGIDFFFLLVWECVKSNTCFGFLSKYHQNVA